MHLTTFFIFAAHILFIAIAVFILILKRQLICLYGSLIALNNYWTGFYVFSFILQLYLIKSYATCISYLLPDVLSLKSWVVEFVLRLLHSQVLMRNFWNTIKYLPSQSAGYQDNTNDWAWKQVNGFFITKHDRKEKQVIAVIEICEKR